jgi:hypothetical protein
LPRALTRHFEIGRDRAAAEWRSVVSLHGSNPGPLMSALGQKRTFWSSNAMSALRPKADIAGRQSDVRFVPIADIPLILADVRPAFHRKLGNGADT